MSSIGKSFKLTLEPQLPMVANVLPIVEPALVTISRLIGVTLMKIAETGLSSIGAIGTTANTKLILCLTSTKIGKANMIICGNKSLLIQL